MDVRHLRGVLAVADAGSVMEAARVLGLAQPALSRTVAAAERELGATLFERSGRGMRPTVAGSALAERARRILADLDEAALAVQQAARASRGALSIGVLSAALYSPLADAISAFTMRHPDPPLVVHEMSSRQVGEALLDGSIDVGVSRAPIRGRDAARVRSAPIAHDRLAAVIGRMHPLAGTRSVSTAQLGSLALIATSAAEEPDLAEVLRPILARTRVHSARDSWTIVRLAALGIGVGLVPRAMSETMTRSGSANVELIPVEPSVPLPPLLLSIRVDSTNSSVRALLEATPELAELTTRLRDG